MSSSSLQKTWLLRISLLAYCGFLVLEANITSIGWHQITSMIITSLKQIWYFLYNLITDWLIQTGKVVAVAHAFSLLWGGEGLNNVQSADSGSGSLATAGEYTLELYWVGVGYAFRAWTWVDCKVAVSYERRETCRLSGFRDVSPILPRCIDG